MEKGIESCREHAKEASTCATLLMMQTTLLACGSEMERVRAADHTLSADYQRDMDGIFTPCVTAHRVGDKRYPEPLYIGGSREALQAAAIATKQAVKEGKEDKLLGIVGPMLRSDYDHKNASFPNTT